VNSIPESAQASIDFRSTGADQLLRLEVALHRAVEDAVEHANASAKARSREFYPLRLPRSATARRHACPAIPAA